MKTCFVGHSWNQPRKKPLRGFVFIYPFSAHHPLDRFYIQMQNTSAFVLRIQSDFGLIYRTNPEKFSLLPNFIFVIASHSKQKTCKPLSFSKSLAMIVQSTVIFKGSSETTKLWPNMLLAGSFVLFSAEYNSQTHNYFFLQDIRELCVHQAAPDSTWAKWGSVVTKGVTQMYQTGLDSL